MLSSTAELFFTNIVLDLIGIHLKNLSSFDGQNIAKGEAISSLSVKSKRQQLVETEDKQHPLSDQKITDLLSQSDLAISRRTVVKYRNALGILASSKRKSY